MQMIEQIKHLKDTGIGLRTVTRDLNHQRVESERNLTVTLETMDELILEYKQVFKTEPVVHLTKHKMSGVFALRWRERGTQRFVQLDDDRVYGLIVNEQRASQRHNKIGLFEIQRLRLNYEYALWFHVRKRIRRFNGSLKSIQSTELL